MKSLLEGHVAGWLNAYFDGELSPEKNRQVEDHLKECSTCRDELESLAGLSDLLSSVPGVEFKTSRERFASQVLLQLPRKVERPLKYRVLKWAWQAFPGGLLAAWAFIQAATLAVTVSGPFLSGWIPGINGSLPAQILITASLSDVLNSVIGLINLIGPLTDIVLVNLGLSLLLTALFMSWLASWWVVKKYEGGLYGPHSNFA